MNRLGNSCIFLYLAELLLLIKLQCTTLHVAYFINIIVLSIYLGYFMPQELYYLVTRGLVSTANVELL